MSVRETIEATLTERFSPSFLEVEDQSERHRGHAGWREGGDTHFHIRIASPKFAGLSRVAQHRAINEALKPQFEAGVHALSIEIENP